MRGEPWMLMDARAFTDFDAASVLLCGSEGEVIDAANAGDFGEGCAVVAPGETEPCYRQLRDGDREASRDE